MNKNFVKINDLCGVVSDENGNVKLVTNDNSVLVDLQEILMTENKVEAQKKVMNQIKEELDKNIDTMKIINVLDGLMVAIEAGLFFAMKGKISTAELTAYMSSCALFYETLLSAATQSLIPRISSRRNATKLCVDLGAEMDECNKLEDILSNMKERSNYEEYVSKEDEEIIVNKHSFNNAKVLKLTRNFNKN